MSQVSYHGISLSPIKIEYLSWKLNRLLEYLLGLGFQNSLLNMVISQYLAIFGNGDLLQSRNEVLSPSSIVSWHSPFHVPEHRRAQYGRSFLAAWKSLFQAPENDQHNIDFESKLHVHCRAEAEAG